MNRLLGGSLEGSTAMSAALGGTISSLSGGDFKNGAMTAAFAHLYNDLQHRTWTYSQSTGEMVGPDGETMQGYSGYGDGLNNPDMQDVENVGPIPRGEWDISDSYGKMRINLKALNVQGISNRDLKSFEIHGDNPSLNYTASQGCIIINGIHNRRLFRQGDRLIVTE